ncbi:MAG: Eco57I restriction-modification methylase domain-containing protein [Nitrospira sp.]|nr:Eco57I restriction-modification methylase domain-containing protein [Nitrospira sp.]
MGHSLTPERLTEFLRAHHFADLFIKGLGWDKENLPSAPLPLSLGDDRRFDINRIVEKRGFVVCVCEAGNNYPATKSDRQQLVTKLSRQHYEHLLIICGKGRQCWIVAIRPQNRPMRTVEVEWHEHQDIQRLTEKLNGIIFEISEEEGLHISDVVDRVRSAFMENAERVTRRFYSEFQRQLSDFADFIEGISARVSKEWYAALMLNRLMFIYFIQKKQFLDGDVDYLENRLNQTQETFGTDTFHDHFYRHFLRRLFAEGLGTPEAERDPQLTKLLGKVPYLNGGLFDLHEVEKEHDGIRIPDEAFENLFDFFKQYNWRLDSRPCASGKEINPDVIGYIFEKYINDRAAKGAYYTQEDITGYIARNTIIPFLLNRAKERCANAFDAQTGIWRFLQAMPDNYIYGAVKKGCDIPDEAIPAHIRCGMDTSAPGLLERRKDWNTATEKRFALPTEIWRETMARRARYREVKARTTNGKVHEIDDLITYNLDIERFASDALREYEGSDFIAAFYEAIAGGQPLISRQRGTRGITVLDPACGSGAFLFAALNILEPLYERCIERMRTFVEEDDDLRQQGKRKGQKKHPKFRAVLDDIRRHQNEKYWIYKTIILNNLYGVDLMKEAAEIAKLRLFLKLAAEAEYDPKKANLGLEPLPDIDFNIRSGNSLVGFVNMEQFDQTVAIDPGTGQRRMDLDQDLSQEIREKAMEVQRANDRFRQAQDSGDDSYRKAKDELSTRLDDLNGKMNRYLAEQYGKQTEAACRQWVSSHQPFHWLTEFYGIVEEDGGFDVVIGNPPYVEYAKVKEQYKIKDYQTESCGNLYAMFVERATGLKNFLSRVGMIVQLPIVCTDRMIPLQQLFTGKTLSWFLNFDDRPGKLFADIQHSRATIFLTAPAGLPTLISSRYKRWHTNIRETIFQDVALRKINEHVMLGSFPKLGDSVGSLLFDKIRKHKTLVDSLDEGPHCYFHNAPQYWVRATDFVPYFWNERDGVKQSVQVKTLAFSSRAHALAVCALLNSSLFYWWFILYSDCRHLNMREIENFPFNPHHAGKAILVELSSIVGDLMADYRRHAVRKETQYKTTGKVVYDEFHPSHSKAIMDRIDVVLAKHYGFTEGELDYIINYDIKYRMGGGNE